MEELMPKKNTYSAVWTFFGLKKTQKEDDESVVCRLCRSVVLARGGNTSNLFSHLKIHHAKEYTSIEKGKKKAKTTVDKEEAGDSGGKQITLAESIERTKPYLRGSQRWKEVTGSVVYFLAKEMVPISTVEKPGFTNMLRKLDPKYEAPSRKYFTKTALPSLYVETRDKLVKDLQEVEYYSLTTDLWSSTGKIEPYLAVTVHYINKEWELKSNCLHTLFMPQDHTGVNISQALQSILESWALPENKLACITTDNGSNVIAAVEILKWNNLTCFGHNLHLGITNSMKDDDRITRAVGVAHKIINTFAHSWKKKRELMKLQTEMDLPRHSLITECTTRWGTRYKMLHRILKQERAIAQVLNNDPRTTHLKPRWQDTEVMESIVSALKPISDFTDILSAEERVTASCLKPLLNHLHNEALVQNKGDTTLKCDIQDRIKEYMRKKYEVESVIGTLNISCCLDPRFMLRYCSDEEASAISQTIIQEGIVVARRVEEQQPPQPTQTEDEIQKSPIPAKKRRLVDILTTTNSSLGEILNHQERLQDELSRYLKYNKPDVSSNPLEWWKFHRKDLPYLSILAKKYLCICATSCPSERVFSTSGNILTAKRNCLKPEKVDQLVFLAKNL